MIAVWMSDKSSEAVSRPDAKQDCGANSEECVSKKGSCACWLASRNAEILERVKKLSVEVSILGVREGRFLRLYLWRGTKSEFVHSCDGIYFCHNHEGDDFSSCEQKFIVRISLFGQSCLICFFFMRSRNKMFNDSERFYNVSTNISRQKEVIEV